MYWDHSLAHSHCHTCNACSQNAHNEQQQSSKLLMNTHPEQFCFYEARNQQISSKEVNVLLNFISSRKDALKHLRFYCESSSFYRSLPSRLLFTVSQVPGLVSLSLNFANTAANSLSPLKKLQQIAGSLKELSLNFQQSHISLLDYHSLCETLEKLTSLTSLELSLGNSLTQKNIRTLGEAIKNMPDMQILLIDFSFNNSSPSDFSYFFSSLLPMKQLRELNCDLSHSLNMSSAFSDSEGLCLRQLFTSLHSSLEVLSFSVIQTETDECFWLNFFSGVRQLKRLRKLSLSLHGGGLARDSYEREGEQQSVIEDSIRYCFDALSENLQCLSIRSDELLLFLRPMKSLVFKKLSHLTLLNDDLKKHKRQQQKQVLSQALMLLHNKTQHQLEQESYLAKGMVLDFFAAHALTITHCQLWESGVLKMILNHMQNTCKSQMLNLMVLYNIITPRILLHPRLVAWDLFY